MFQAMGDLLARNFAMSPRDRALFALAERVGLECRRLHERIDELERQINNDR